MFRHKPLVTIVRTGLISYGVGLKLQKLLSKQDIKSASEFCNYLVLQEYYPVYTVGIRMKDYSKDEMRLRQLGADFHYTNRGGLLTFHGPGQLVGYPLLHLKHFNYSLRCYISALEQLIVNTCLVMGINDATTTEHTGVWIRDKKICAIGVRAARYITSHGFSLNCCNDLEWFKHIVPCGLEAKGVTSLSKELQRNVSIKEASDILIKVFSKTLNCVISESQNLETQLLIAKTIK